MSGTLGDELAVESIKKGFTDYVLKGQLNRLPMVLQRAQERTDASRSEVRAARALYAAASSTIARWSTMRVTGFAGWSSKASCCS